MCSASAARIRCLAAMCVASVGTPQAQEILSPAVRELFAPMSAGLQDQFAKCRGSGKARERTCCVTWMGSGSVAYFVLCCLATCCMSIVWSAAVRRVYQKDVVQKLIANRAPFRATSDPMFSNLPAFRRQFEFACECLGCKFVGT